MKSGEAVPIQGGARMTGKIAGMQVAFLNIQADHLDVFDDHDVPRRNVGFESGLVNAANRVRRGIGAAVLEGLADRDVRTRRARQLRAPELRESLRPAHPLLA